MVGMTLASPTRSAIQPLAVAGGTPPPTDEQEAIHEAFNEGGTVVVEALAGTGKTTTLRQLAAIADRDRRTGLYLAYNKAIQQEAQVRFPNSVLTSTAHALAYGAVGRHYAHRLPGNGGGRRLYARQIAALLGVKPAKVLDAFLNPVQLVRLAEATVNRFCLSGDHQIGPQHLPARAAHLGPVDALADAILPVAGKVWGDIIDPRGKLYFHHDHYLKMWQLLRPRLPYSYLMFDEAQDANPVIAEVVANQAGHCQLIYVGDRNQQLYAWRGAVDAMQGLAGTRLALTKSFRFGPAIADEANRWLELLGSPYQVRGHEPVQSRVGPLDGPPDAILCRTNGAALSAILAAQEEGIPVAMAPGDKAAGKDLRRFAFAALDLMKGNGTDHPDLVAFTTWKELLTYVDEEEGGADLERLVNITNRIGPHGVISAVNRLVTKEQARLTVSTAHKAKGLEWGRVKVADDFTPPEPDEDGETKIDPADLMLAYVTVTRAKNHLDPGSLNPTDWK